MSSVTPQPSNFTSQDLLKIKQAVGYFNTHLLTCRQHLTPEYVQEWHNLLAKLNQDDDELTATQQP